MKEKMKIYSCHVVEDLLPLYQDGICSEDSRAIVNAHLEECDHCRDLAKRMTDSLIEDQMSMEKAGVLSRHKKKQTLRSITAGLLGAGIFTLILLLIIAICTGGDWYGVTAVSIFYGFSIVIVPMVLYQVQLPVWSRNAKGLITMLWDTAWLNVLLLTCGYYVNQMDYWNVVWEITIICVAIVWILFVIARYVRMPKVFRVGICFLVISLCFAFLRDVIDWILYDFWENTLYHADFGIWVTDTINSNVYMILFLVSLLTAFICIYKGIRQKRKK